MTNSKTKSLRVKIDELRKRIEQGAPGSTQGTPFDLNAELDRIKERLQERADQTGVAYPSERLNQVEIESLRVMMEAARDKEDASRNGDFNAMRKATERSLQASREFHAATPPTKRKEQND